VTKAAYHNLFMSYVSARLRQLLGRIPVTQLESDGVVDLARINIDDGRTAGLDY